MAALFFVNCIRCVPSNINQYQITNSSANTSKMATAIQNDGADIPMLSLVLVLFFYCCSLSLIALLALCSVICDSKSVSM